MKSTRFRGGWLAHTGPSPRRREGGGAFFKVGGMRGRPGVQSGSRRLVACQHHDVPLVPRDRWIYTQLAFHPFHPRHRSVIPVNYRYPIYHQFRHRSRKIIDLSGFTFRQWISRIELRIPSNYDFGFVGNSARVFLFARLRRSCTHFGDATVSQESASIDLLKCGSRDCDRKQRTIDDAVIYLPSFLARANVCDLRRSMMILESKWRRECSWSCAKYRTNRTMRSKRASPHEGLMTLAIKKAQQ